MFVILGLIILIAALVVAVAGVLANGGTGHDLGGGFSVFGYHVTGSTGTLFLYGIIVGAAALLGLALLLSGARRGRRSLRQSRREQTVIDRERDDLVDQRDTARTQADDLARAGTGRHGRHWFGHRAAHR
ncbi:hypothetical protein [Streptomyces melanogenes]|uniref:Uncharacterized protein n=1 Tax=Streptomyces melanogenes TaxID=67326 RepID=A0ABZ1XBQ4_9ACTN|nr:hypothetical protein [Streptomyces melanogenes]